MEMIHCAWQGRVRAMSVQAITYVTTGIVRAGMAGPAQLHDSNAAAALYITGQGPGGIASRFGAGANQKRFGMKMARNIAGEFKRGQHRHAAHGHASHHQEAIAS